MTPHPQRCRKLFRNCDGILSCLAPFADDVSEEMCIYGIGGCEFRELINASHSSAQSEQEIRERVLDEATELLFEQFKKFTNEKYIFGTDWLADWWIERVGYLRTPEGQAELRNKQRW